MFTIKNDKLTVEVNPRGAELTHVINNSTAFDYIWNGANWSKHAPILFPSIGRSTQDSYLINGEVFPMPQHGFVSDLDFDLIEQTESSLILQLHSNEESLKFYPFQFTLLVAYELSADKLAVKFEVLNENQEELSFSLGFHPAFNLSGNFEDWQLQFSSNAEKLNQYEIVKNPFPYRTGKQVEFADSLKDIKLSRELFEKGLVILKEKIYSVLLSNSKEAYSIKMDLSDFSHLCLWTKEDMALPYLCIEAFIGLPDISGQLQELLSKQGNKVLSAKESVSYKVDLVFGGA